MKQKLIALFLIIVMVASALTAVGFATTTTAAAATATQTTLSVSKTNPKVGEQVTFTAQLLKWNGASWVGVPSESTPQLKIIHYINGVMVADVAKTTGSNGKITWVKSWSSVGSTTYYAYFGGDATYGKSLSAGKTVTGQKIPTQTTLSVTKTNAKVGEQVTFTVGLKRWNAATSSYVALANKNVALYHTLNGHLYTDVTKKTDASGKFTFSQSFSSIGQRLYYAKFAGDSSYATSKSGTTTITVKYGTTLSLHLDVILPQVPQSDYYLTGYLKDQNGKPLVGQKIQFYWRIGTSGPWQTGGVGNTDNDGFYVGISATDYPTTIQYYSRYVGNGTHWGASSAIGTVTTKWQPKLSLYAWSGHPYTDIQVPVGTKVPLGGYLTDKYNRGPLVNKLVTFYWSASSSGPWTTGASVNTGADGLYQNYGLSNQPKTLYYKARYAGDGVHWPAESTPVVKVTWY